MEVSGDKSARALYQQDVQKGIKLFEAGFNEIQKKSAFEQQKDEFEKSMGESLQVIQDAAAALANQKLIQMKEQLAKDYKSYLANPTPDGVEKVQKDIDQIKKSANA